jgi:hypothetical protein
MRSRYRGWGGLVVQFEFCLDQQIERAHCNCVRVGSSSIGLSERLQGNGRLIVAATD